MANNSTRAKQNMQLKKKFNRSITQELVATAQDIKFARLLAGNNKTASDRAVRSLRKWMEQRNKSRIPLTEADLMVIWQGLFYSMWMADKPLVQEECAERIASLIHSLDVKSGIKFFQTGMKTLGSQWYGIDQWRYDKFLMFIRRFLRQTFVFLKSKSWDIKLIKQFAAVIEQTVLSSEKPPPLSLVLHFCDIYTPELAKISEGQLNPNILNEFLVPFVTALAASTDQRLMNAIAENVFRYMMKQSNAGQEYEDKFNVWKKLGFPGGNINSLQRADGDEEEDNIEEHVEDEEEDDEVFAQDDHVNEKDDDTDIIDDTDDEVTGLDPRAGRVNVVLPQIHFSCKNLINLLVKYQFQAKKTKARSMFKKLIQEFTDLSSGDFPLGMKEIEQYEDDGSTNVKKSANRLVKFENKLYGRNKIQSEKKRKVEEVENEEGDQEVPIMKKPKLDKSRKEEQKKKEGSKSKNLQEKKKEVQEIKQKANKEDKKKEKLLKEKQQKLKKLEEKQRNLRNIYEEKQKQNLDADNVKKSKLKAKQEVEDEKLELQIRKALKTSRNLELEKEELFKRNLKLKSKKKKLENEVTKTKQKLFNIQKLNTADCFVRNSGTWLVYDPETESDSEVESQTSVRTLQNGVKKASLTHKNLGSMKKLSKRQESPKVQAKSPQKLSPKRLQKLSLKTIQAANSRSTKSPKESPTIQKKVKSSPKLNITNGRNPSTTSSNSLKSISSSSLTLHTSTPQKSPEISPQKEGSPKSKQIFPGNEWDVDLQDGEVEFFVPSKKFLAKRKSIGAPVNLGNPVGIGILKGKNRRRSEPNRALNFSNSSSSSTKKVKIDLRLNQSQEVYEHHAQIKSSPGIPFDADKKPSRSVIKSNALPSPINPFYRKGKRINIQF